MGAFQIRFLVAGEGFYKGSTRMYESTKKQLLSILPPEYAVVKVWLPCARPVTRKVAPPVSPEVWDKRLRSIEAGTPGA